VNPDRSSDLKIAPGSPDWDAHISGVNNLLEQFPESVDEMLEHDEARNSCDHAGGYHLELRAAMDKLEQREPYLPQRSVEGSGIGAGCPGRAFAEAVCPNRKEAKLPRHASNKRRNCKNRQRCHPPQTRQR